MKKVIFLLILTVMFLLACKKQPYDYRDKWVGNYSCIETISDFNLIPPGSGSVHNIQVILSVAKTGYSDSEVDITGVNINWGDGIYLNKNGVGSIGPLDNQPIKFYSGDSMYVSLLGNGAGSIFPWGGEYDTYYGKK